MRFGFPGPGAALCILGPDSSLACLALLKDPQQRCEGRAGLFAPGLGLRADGGRGSVKCFWGGAWYSESHYIVKTFGSHLIATGTARY